MKTEYDLIVIGSGPHALSLLSRILEKSPFSLVSDQEHNRLAHLSSKNLVHTCCFQLSTDQLKQRVLVIDKNGTWMNRWNKSFKTYQISHLRSPLYFHPDPYLLLTRFDPDALRSYAESENRMDELYDITAVMSNASKKSHKRNKKYFKFIRSIPLFNNRDREQFYTPSQSLFEDFCDSLVDRYELDDIIHKGTVQKLEYQDGMFSVLVDSSVIKAKRVVCALGNTNRPNLPAWYPQDHNEFIRHAVEFADTSITLPPSIKPRDKVLIVGGGLTSAQLIQQALIRDLEPTLVCRGKLQVKQFDLDLEWVGRTAFVQFAKFWGHDSKTRLGMIKNAKGGGSITPEYHCKIKEWKEQEVLVVREQTRIESVEYDNGWIVKFDTGVQERYDLIWLATGAKNEITSDTLFADIMTKHPIETMGGLPCLTKELYFMSSYASLSAGPNATNLQGGRVIADRLGSVLWEKWLEELDVSVDNVEKRPVLKTLADLTTNFGNYWSALVDLDS